MAPFRPFVALALAWLLAGACLVPPALAQSPAPAPTVVVDPTVSRGTWDGWGTSLSWWAKVFGDRDDVADLLFTARVVEFQGERLPGLGMNVARYNVGACGPNEVGGKRMAVSKIIKPYRQIEGFWLDGKSPDPGSSSWDWSADANQRAMLRRARDRGVDRFELFANAPMWWMCANLNPSGAAKPTDDNLAPEHQRTFAAYLATVARQARDHWGIAFATVDPFNEPMSSWWFADCKQEGCHFEPETQAAVLRHLRAELDGRGLRDLAIAASDENTYDEAVRTWASFDAPTRGLVTQINVHGYQNRAGRRDLVRAAAQRDGKRLWNSEYGENDPSGLRLAENLHLDFQHLRPTAWCYWQPLDGGGWGLLDSDLTNAVIRSATPKFFVLAQYSRHLRPGMTLLEAGDADTVAAYHAGARRLVLIIRHGGSEPRARRYDLSRFRALPDGPVARWVTEPRGTARYQEQRDARVVGGHLEVTLPPHSVQTVEVENVDLP